jgi:hypothetical protein
MFDIVLRTIIPILLLIGIGFISRRMKIMRAGDERVLSAYVYYFALPALFLITMAETVFTSEVLMFIFAGITPILVAVAIFTGSYFIFRFPKNVLYLLILSTIFGSLAFFGIPFITFAFPVEGERLATLSAATVAIVSVTLSLVVLELYGLEEVPKWKGVKHVAKRLSRNPLILSILFGVFLSVTRMGIPAPISDALHMLGSTTSVVAIFMLGVFLYGRQYTNITTAFKLSLLRIVFLPAVAFLTIRLLGLSGVEGSVVVLMHGMPIAISMIVLSERYNFYKETIASLILISSLAAALYLNLWLLLLGHY